MTKDEVIELVDDEAVFYPDLDEAIIGVATRCGMPSVVAYDYDKAIEILKKSFEITEADLDSIDIENGMTLEDKKYEMAVEWYDYNVVGGYIGEYTPIFVTQTLN
jgi:hypothetical protein